MALRKSVVQERFSRHAELYDQYAPVQQEMARQLAEQLDGLEREPRAILEIGCGTGTLTSLVLKRFPGARLVAVDIAPGMVEEARRRLAGEAHRCLVVQADAEEYVLEQPDHTYDLIVSSACFQWLTQPRSTLTHLYRLLTPGGRLHFTTFGPRTFNELHESFAAAYRVLGKPPVRHGLSLASGTEWMQMLRGAGFHPCLVVSRQTVLHYSGVREFLHAVKNIGASASQASYAGLGGRRLLTEMIRQYETRFRSPEGVAATYELLYAWGERPFPGT